MVDEKTIEVLLKAKKDRFAITLLTVLSSLSLFLLIFLEVAGITSNYTIVLASISAVLMSSSAGANKWVSVSRDELISTLEKIINNDPQAIKLLADRKKST